MTNIVSNERPFFSVPVHWWSLFRSWLWWRTLFMTVRGESLLILTLIYNTITVRCVCFNQRTMREIHVANHVVCFLSVCSFCILHNAILKNVCLPMHACSWYFSLLTLPLFSLLGKGRKLSSLNEDQKLQKITTPPTILEYFCYVFNFHSLLAGPSCTIHEFQSFMDGSNLKPMENPNAFANVMYFKINWNCFSVPFFSIIIINVLPLI